MNKITRSILEDLETVRESLLSLSDDIWLSIDHNNTVEMQRGCQFKQEYNEKMVAFDSLATDISGLVQQFTNVNLQSNEIDGNIGATENERLIRELKLDQPHRITEDFTFKRPHGFILKGSAITGVITWKRLYTRFCQSLFRLDPETFNGLTHNERFISSHGNHAFSPTKDGFHEPIKIGAFFTEGHMSANSFRDSMKKLLEAFQINDNEFDIFLRQDRDANRNRANAA